MKFENDFDVEAPIEEVFKAILDVERVAPCVPGAKVVEQTEEDVYKVAIKVKVGPMSMQYSGDVKIVESDPELHRAVMRTRAKEARGQGTADANVEMHLEGDDSRTHGHISTDVKLSGRAAAMGGGVIQDVSARIVDTFAENLAAMLAEGKSAAVETPAPAAEGKSPTSTPPPAAEEPPEAGGEREALASEPSAEAAAAAASEPIPEVPEHAASKPIPEPAPAAASEPTPEVPEDAASRPGPSAATPEPTAPRGASGPDQEASLPVLSIVGSVIAGRLRDPRALAAALGVVAVAAFVLGRRGH